MSPDRAVEFDASADDDRSGRRLTFLAELARDLLPRVASQAVDACASDVVAHLKAEPASGFADFGPTAWDEAVRHPERRRAPHGRDRA